MRELAGIFFGTFLAEDLTAIGAALLAQQGRVSLLPAILACSAGIYLGDLALWLLGRVGRRRVLTGRTARFAGSLGTALPAAILGSRFVPGTRLPLYVAAGASGVPFTRFAGWTFLAVVTWTPALIILTTLAGAAVVRSITSVVGSSLVAMGLAALLVFTCQRTVVPRLRACWSRLSRWEFWPMWLFYAPVACWTLWLAIRHGGYTTITAANPGIQDGGVVGESKFDILRTLPRQWTLAAARIRAGELHERLHSLDLDMLRLGLSWPLILKPDVGQRGAGVKLVRSRPEACAYFTQFGGPVIVQEYHPGPFEAGIFYYRRPNERRGRILSITDKQFPAVVGDGHSTLEALVNSHDRYRMQAATFMTRLGSRRSQVPAAGVRVTLTIAGNHAQGTLFRDGFHLITPALEERVDGISQSFPGFFIGRFDVRYSDLASFKAGRDLAIVELNGATAESTDIYDPSKTLIAAYRRLCLQWQLVFEIGAANRASGTAATSPGRLFALIRQHLAARTPFPVSD